MVRIKKQKPVSGLYATPREAQSVTGLSIDHLRSLAERGEVLHRKTPTGQTRYLVTSLMRLGTMQRIGLYISGAGNQKYAEDLDASTQELLKQIGLHQYYQVTVFEAAAELAKPLPLRNGFKILLGNYRNGVINTFVATPTNIIHQDSQTLAWLSVISIMGFYCYVIENEEIVPYPYDVIEYIRLKQI